MNHARIQAFYRNVVGVFWVVTQRNNPEDGRTEMAPFSSRFSNAKFHKNLKLFFMANTDKAYFKVRFKANSQAPAAATVSFCHFVRPSACDSVTQRTAEWSFIKCNTRHFCKIGGFRCS